MKLAICQELFEDWEWDRQCKLIAEIGYTGIEAAPFALGETIHDVTAQRRVELREQGRPAGWRSSGCTGCWRRPRVCT